MAKLTPSKMEEVISLWRLYGKCSSVCTVAGVTRYTAELFKPGSRVERVPRGYETWSAAVRSRWDEYWASSREAVSP